MYRTPKGIEAGSGRKRLLAREVRGTPTATRSGEK